MGSRGVNNYNPDLLRVWETNRDIHQAHNQYKALRYTAAYFSKSESEVSESLKKAAEESKTKA